MPYCQVNTAPGKVEDDCNFITLTRQVIVFCGVIEMLKLETADCTVYVLLQPVDKFVAVKVKIPDAVEKPGLLIGEGVGRVGANQPKAIPALELAFKEMVPELHETEYVAEGIMVFDVIIIGTVAWHKLIVFVNNTE